MWRLIKKQMLHPGSEGCWNSNFSDEKFWFRSTMIFIYIYLYLLLYKYEQDYNNVEKNYQFIQLFLDQFTIILIQKWIQKNLLQITFQK